jgi:Alpha/beta hydrolase domain
VIRVRTRATLAGALTALLLTPAAAGATPLPHVTGPLPVSATSYPFGAADHQLVPQDLRRFGYVEEEYLASGKANVYSWPAPGPAIVRTANAPYTTRVLVRRPAKGRHFSGNVVVEILNPSNTFDLNIGWALAHRQLIRNGDAWVGVTGKPISVAALKTFDPVRYGSLSFANPLPLDNPHNCKQEDIQTLVDPVKLRSRTTEDGLVWDINSQVGAWIRSGERSNPFTSYGRHRGRHWNHHGHTRSAAQKLYGFGYSQTGSFLYDYINAIQPLVVQSDGRPMYDAYIVAVAGGGFIGLAPINQCEAVPPPLADPRYQLTNTGTPILHIMSQSDYLFGISARRPDSDAPQDRYRHYETAGAAHATPDELFYAAAPADITRAGRDVPPMSCNEGPRSRFPSSIFYDAAIRNLDLWVRRGIAPPHADPILVSGGAPVLDQFGNVQGGLRSPFLDVPTSTWFGNSTGASFCIIAGHEVLFDHARLAQLYPTHQDYVRAVARDTARLVGQRFLTLPDGIRLIRDAAAADVP